MTYLTAPQTQTTKQRTYRYFVEIASDKLDYEGVPESFQIVDVVVLTPTRDAIKTLIAAAGWLNAFTIVSHWIPTDSTEF